MNRGEALAAIAAALNVADPDTATPAQVADAVTDLVAAVADLRTHVYPSIVDGVLAAHNVHLP